MLNTDKVSSSLRSLIMSKVRSKETSLEKTLRSLLWINGIRYRKNNTVYFGKPDLLFKQRKTVAFIDSCFWHGCPRHLRMPASNRKYWISKIEHNRGRDLQVNAFYRSNGWKIIRIWEHEYKNLIRIINKFKKVLNLNK